MNELITAIMLTFTPVDNADSIKPISIERIAKSKGKIRVHNKLDIELSARKSKGKIRMNDTFDVEQTGRKSKGKIII